jgi:polyisoprenoid-binding protein YceI
MSTATAMSRVEALTGSYEIDPGHSRIGFVARHAMVTKVRGSFNDFAGGFTVDGAHPEQSRAQLVIQASSIDTRNAERDAHLRSNDFLAMDEHPEIRFTSTAIEQVDGERYRLTGDLEIRGVTKPVTIELELTGAATDPYGSFRIGFEGSTTINRKDWGVSWNAALEAGGVLVSEKVVLEFEVSAVKTA